LNGGYSSSKQASQEKEECALYEEKSVGKEEKKMEIETGR
jgi:hypothetical protein